MRGEILSPRIQSSFIIVQVDCVRGGAGKVKGSALPLREQLNRHNTAPNTMTKQREY